MLFAFDFVIYIDMMLLLHDFRSETHAKNENYADVGKMAVN